MNIRFPDAGTVRTVLSLASRAPSVHNTQPWRWRVDGASLHLYSDAGRQLPNIDPDGRDLMLSCGAALHHCVVAFAAVGWLSKVTRLPNPGRPQPPGGNRTFARIPLTPSTSLAPRRYRGGEPTGATTVHWPVPVGDVALMAARAARTA